MEKSINESKGEVLIYRAKDGQMMLDVQLQQETVWLTQKQMSTLFDKDVRTVNEHIQNVFKEKELSPKATIRNLRIVQKEGERSVERDIDFYNLDVIILAIVLQPHSYYVQQAQKNLTRAV